MNNHGHKKTGMSGKNTHKVSAHDVHPIAGKAVKATKDHGRDGLSKVNKVAGPKKSSSLVHNSRHGKKS